MRKTRFIENCRCYHLISRLAHRAFFLDDDEKTRAVELVLKLPKVRQRDPSETGVAVTYRLVTSGDPSFVTGTVDKEVTDVPAGEGPTFTTELPTSGGKVKYYRVEIELGK